MPESCLDRLTYAVISYRCNKAKIDLALGGYRDMTDFMIQAAQEKAKEIIMEREQIIASERDSEVFFNAVMNLESPNEPLRKAAEQYKSL
jgi:uncharacterized protein (DUF1778 family)